MIDMDIVFNHGPQDWAVERLQRLTSHTAVQETKFILRSVFITTTLKNSRVL